MPKIDPRVDKYIEKCAAFAQPVMKHLRRLIHKACPEVEETIKWSFPNFESYGAVMCSIAAFKQHCAFGFWKASIMKDPDGILQIKDRNAMGHLDRITSIKDLPSEKILLAYIKEAARLNKEKIKVPPRVKPVAQKPLEMSDELQRALNKNKKAKAVFEAFSPSNKKEYILWITEAKTEETRQKRIETAIEWIAEGKGRNWKYEKKK
jgi:uncharacterized protein YdeI (YjbR/CyaY-like superfamily)